MIDYENEHVGHTMYRGIIGQPPELIPQNWDGIYAFRDLELSERAGEITRDSINTRIFGALAARQVSEEARISADAIKAANELAETE